MGAPAPEGSKRRANEDEQEDSEGDIEEALQREDLSQNEHGVPHRPAIELAHGTAAAALERVPPGL